MKPIQALLASITILFMTRSATAQEREPALACVIYEFIHVNDTNHKDQPHREEMILRLGENSSKYTSYTMESNLQKERIANMGGTMPAKKLSDEILSGRSIVMGGGGVVAVVFGPGFTQETLFQHTKENKLNKIAALGATDYLIELPLPKIDWKIDKETRQIGGYTCQKAIGDYAGRTYTAWFTPDLPFRNGPWKLSGLPGLILEAKDAKNEVAFLFKEISRDTANQTTGTKIKKLVTVSDKAFDRVREAYQNDPIGVSQSKLPAGSTASAMLMFIDATMKFNTGESANALLEKYRKETIANNNNPVELIK